MKLTKGSIAVLAAAGVLTAIAAGSAFAGTWSSDASGWHYENDAGQKVTNGWVKDDGEWYLMKNGIMQTGWQQTEDGWFYLDPNNGGAMAADAYVDGYYLNESGLWVQDYEEEEEKEEKAVVKKSSSKKSSEDAEEKDDKDENKKKYTWDEGDASNGPGLGYVGSSSGKQKEDWDGSDGPKTKNRNSIDDDEVDLHITYTKGSNKNNDGDEDVEYDEGDDDGWGGDAFDEDDYDPTDESGGSKADYLANHNPVDGSKAHRKAKTDVD